MLKLVLMGLFSGLVFGGAKAISVVIVRRKYPKDQWEEKKDEINKKSNSLMPLLALGIALVLIILPLTIAL